MNEVQQLSNRDKIFAVEEAFKKEPQIELEVKHYFVPGVYIRELFVPKSVSLVGKIHKYKQFHLITSGDISILTENGFVRFKAPTTIISPSGAKRIAYAHEDTTWLMVHGTDETDVNKIEDHFIANSDEDYLKFVEEQNRQLALSFGDKYA